MAIVYINYDCGCGFHGKTVEEAIGHADEQKHSLCVLGSVMPSEPKVRRASLPVSASPRSDRKAAAVVPLEVQAESKIDFGNLRARLQKK